MKSAFKILVTTLMFVGCGLIGCDDSDGHIRVGAKNISESMILAEMIAALAEQQGIKVTRSIPLGDTNENFAALKRGDIDIYPEYSSEGLVLLGHLPITNGKRTMSRVEDLFQPLGLRWGKRFGFKSNYGLIMKSDRAEKLDIKSLSDLARDSLTFTIGVDSKFNNHPTVGLSAMQRRYGMKFYKIEVIDNIQRIVLYEKLIDNRVDVIIGHTTDPQIDNNDFIFLEDDLNYFPVYETVPLMRNALAVEYPKFTKSLEVLAGKLTADVIRSINEKVETQGQRPSSVAKQTLVEYGLLKTAGNAIDTPPLQLAMDSFSNNTSEAVVILKAVRKTFSNRDVHFAINDSPLKMIDNGHSRLAMISTESLFDLRTPLPSMKMQYEGLGVAGNSVAHLITNRAGPVNIDQIKRLGTAVTESSSYQMAKILRQAYQVNLNIHANKESGMKSLFEMLDSNEVDSILVCASLGNRQLNYHLKDISYKIVALNNWKSGNNRIRYPFVKQTVIPAQTYEGQFTPIDSVGTQFVVVGPSRTNKNIVGDHGPGGAFEIDMQPLPPIAVKRLNHALASDIVLEPSINKAKILLTPSKKGSEPLQASMSESILTIILISFLLWASYLYIRKY